MWDRLQEKFNGKWKLFSKECDTVGNLPLVDKWLVDLMEICHIPMLHLLDIWQKPRLQPNG